MQKCGAYVGDNILKELCAELDPKQTGQIPYQAFLDTLYITKMYLNEITLYGILKDADVSQKGGVTILQMKEILKTHPEFELPDEALPGHGPKSETTSHHFTWQTITGRCEIGPS